VGQEVGQLGEARLFLMGGLLLADELADVRARLAQAQAEAARLQGEAQQLEARAAMALNAATRKVEALAAIAG
jgi:cell division protein ZapA